MSIRPGRTVRNIERPYTRQSKSAPRKSYVVGVPFPKTHQFEMGNRTGNFDTILFMKAKLPVQIRDQSLEAARIVTNKYLDKVVGPMDYFMKILAYPHQVIREKPIATGAGADRYSQGMAKAFGKPVTTAIQTRKDMRLVELRIHRNNLELGKSALKKFGLKIPTPIEIEITH